MAWFQVFIFAMIIASILEVCYNNNRLRWIVLLNMGMPIILIGMLIIDPLKINIENFNKIEKIKYRDSISRIDSYKYLEQKDIENIFKNNIKEINKIYKKEISKEFNEISMVFPKIKLLKEKISDNCKNINLSYNNKNLMVNLNHCNKKESIKLNELNNPIYYNLQNIIYYLYYKENNCSIPKNEKCEIFKKNQFEINKKFEKELNTLLNLIILISITIFIFSSLVIIALKNKLGSKIEEDLTIAILCFLISVITLFWYIMFSETISFLNMEDKSVFYYLENQTRLFISTLGFLILIGTFTMKDIMFKLNIAYLGGRNRILIFKKDNKWCYCYYYDNRKAYYIDEEGRKDYFTYQELKEYKFIFEKNLYLSKSKEKCPFEKITKDNEVGAGIYPEDSKKIRYIIK